jgi:hypothetical protein
LSELDTLIGGLIGVTGAVVAEVVVHALDEKRERNKLRRETALLGRAFIGPTITEVL